ncbi:MAG: hypothetical protein HPPSJP_4960 [Candidatus Hepatoplasma scabrum]|nr:MAG: hypothetical protein HPPSJP_4960 [Candidatus Hepatoplasma sp.]
MPNRNFKKSQRNTIWKENYGNSNSGIDLFGRNITEDNFEVDHIFPKSKGGKTIIKNAQPLHPLSNWEKADNLSGYVNGKKFKIKNKRNGKIKINVK